MCGRGSVSVRQPKGNKAVKKKPKLQWRSLGVGDARGMECLLKRATGNECTSPEERPCGPQLARPSEQGCPSLLELTS
jgi:hypothetical protein